MSPDIKTGYMETMQASAKIFLDYENGVTEDTRFRRKQVFTSAQLPLENRQPFGNLHTWNEEVLAAGASSRYHAEKDTTDVFIPVVGSLLFCNGRESTPVAPGELLCVSSAESSNWSVSSPYTEAGTLISFLHIGFRDSVNRSQNRLLGFEVAATGIANVLDLGSASFSITRMKGRQVTSHRLADTSGGLFVYALQGAFEVEGRLLHPGDGLALWNLTEAEAEALSEEAIVIFLDLPRISNPSV
ncbi:MAG: hypothetical protein QM664_03470 [Flavihumibacter sp.]